MEAKRQIEQQDMGALEDLQQPQQQQQQQQQRQVVEVQTHPPRQCPCCNSLETMFGYYSHFRDNQPRYRCMICSLYWTRGEMPREISVGDKRKLKNQHSDLVASASTNRVSKIPRSAGRNASPTSGSDVRINRQHDSVSRILASERYAPSNPSSSMRINEPRTLHASPLSPVTQSATNTLGSGLLTAVSALESANQLLAAVSGGANRHLYHHGLREQPEPQQQFYNSQNFGWNEVGSSVHQVSSVQQNPVPAVPPSIPPSMFPLCFNNGNNVLGREAVSWDRNTTQNGDYISELQTHVTVVQRSTTVLQFQPNLYNIGSVSNPEAHPRSWNNNSSIGQLQSEVTPVMPATTDVPDFHLRFYDVGGASDPGANLLNNDSGNGIDGLPVNPTFWPHQPHF